jgi:ketosteroid isomerase-like protein
MENRLTWALERRGGEWKIVHEHTSAPADFETAKVRLRR